jgi:hypothetical protein
VWNRIRQIRREEQARIATPTPDAPGRAVAPGSSEGTASAFDGSTPSGMAERVDES